MLKQRVLTAILLLPAALAAIFLLPVGGFAIAIALVMLLAAKEWGSFIQPGDRLVQVSFTLSIAVLLAALTFIMPVDLMWNQQQLHPLAEIILQAGGLWWLVALGLVVTYVRSVRMWHHSMVLKAVFGQLTLIPAFVAMMVLHSLNQGDDPLFGSYLVLAVFLIVWGADTGAYFFGRAFGKHKLAPHVSPGKTIEGLLGGLLVCVLLAIAGWLWLPNNGFMPVLAVVLVTALASALGDLSESMFKRSANIKDSGRLLPGHGGILDRIDSITAAMPVFALLYLYWWM
ncbi:phosphatidate cytidylyltransferase [Ferrimonas sediminum]|uniref:Phosphatidate cytidylyltransferase n=1 Tax=Ferrimonas sediminum TaxID=718193 RepID=A0A1G8LLG1_9GAMM|nr:phosphatidate cytidylyltransferase [Ferrimonas sediminum]SDI56483.1 phosphatidate cytidylyltransferase [Ferrimonas sediminum]